MWMKLARFTFYVAATYNRPEPLICRVINSSKNDNDHIYSGTIGAISSSLGIISIKGQHRLQTLATSHYAAFALDRSLTRTKTSSAADLNQMEDMEVMVEGRVPLEQVPGEENESRTLNSEQIEMEIAQILDKINNFTQMVSELLDSGKSMLKELSNEFEERVFLIHKEQMEKWQEEIKELRLLDAANEETDALLHNAKFLLQSIPGGTSQ
ncbi:uncharacterized protein [Henckelia pumila]|uniref:uncharacterized protein n=1 Tax=Henckelia pumila TaxID=405737 RepID=UPI003C6DFE6E